MSLYLVVVSVLLSKMNRLNVFPGEGDGETEQDVNHGDTYPTPAMGFHENSVHSHLFIMPTLSLPLSPSTIPIQTKPLSLWTEFTQ